jgi:integrase
MNPFFGDKLLANIHNAAMKEFVNHIADLSPATIRDYVNIAKSVVASARDAEGKVLFPREWDDDFLDAPEINEQKQPTVDREEMEAILRESQEPYLTLYSLLAGCGPMRPGEALGLDIRAIHPDFRTLDIVQKAKRGELQDYTKTKKSRQQTRACGGLARGTGHPAARVCTRAAQWFGVLQTRRFPTHAAGYLEIQPAPHPEKTRTRTGRAQHFSALSHYRDGDS